jgi:hypothetical protein
MGRSVYVLSLDIAATFRSCVKPVVNNAFCLHFVLFSFFWDLAGLAKLCLKSGKVMGFQPLQPGCYPLGLCSD